MLFPLLPIPAPVFTSHVRSRQNLLTTFFSCLGFLVLLSERALPFLGVSESPARRASGRGSKDFRVFLVVPGVVIDHMILAPGLHRKPPLYFCPE